MKNVRLSLYTGKVVRNEDDDDMGLQRNPVMRVYWKPDAIYLSPSEEHQFNSYIDASICHMSGDSVGDDTAATIGVLLDLVGHKIPRMHVVEIIDELGSKKDYWLPMLDYATAFPRCRSWHTALQVQGGGISIEEGEKGPFDVVIYEEFLASMTQNEMDLLRAITNSVAQLIWLTSANIMDEPNPNLSLTSGFSRALVMEQPSLQFIVTDVGSIIDLRSNTTSICESVGKILAPGQDVDDREFVHHNGLLYVSRLGPDLAVNELFRKRLGLQEAVSEMTLSAAQPAKLSIGRVGVTETIHFQEVREPVTSPPSGFADVAVKAVSLNAKDVYALNGRVETKTGTSAIEFGGLVTAVGPDVTHIQPGDRVVVCIPNTFSTTERVPAWSAHKLLPHEDLKVMVTLPTIYCAALYALRDRTGLRAGESVLIHSGAGAFGIAAITMAQWISAIVYTTVGSPEKRKFVVSKLGVPAENIFHSRNESFVEGLSTATGGRGVDVAINSLVGDLMHASWRCVAKFGRFVELGKQELVDAGKLEMHVFLRNATFTAFDLTDMIYQDDEFYRDKLFNLEKDVFGMYRSGEIKPPPIKVFDVGEIAQAYRYFLLKEWIGKVVAPSKYLTKFDAEKTYLLVGCLGGLGRSLSGWMMNWGAKKFVFLGRSGCDKPSAQELVNRLRSDGAHVTVVRGDVLNKADVKNAVAACLPFGEIGGVVQAGMGLHESIFSQMSNEAWHTTVAPKWTGTWNLHNAMEGNDAALDFFLLTSSMAGAVGVATESSYCAANAFLDAFAYWRRHQGKPAVSIGLGMVSEVGYLHENPDIEAILLRRGLRPLNEDEFLQVVDLALSGAAGNFRRHTSTSSHMLTGMETLDVRKLLEKGFDVTHTAMDDQRSAILSAALEMSQTSSSGDRAASSNRDRLALIAAVPWLKTLPGDIAEALVSEADATSLDDSLGRLISKRFSNLILMPLDQVQLHKSFEDFGIDSMIASEFRTWFWNTLQVDIPLLDLLSGRNSLSSIVTKVKTKLLGA
ncbi:KR-domain-containing protein [Hypoxylon sp. FL1284]|nr:KR-domain-containing protein [Hypoxylon sp. FL1284]